MDRNTGKKEILPLGEHVLARRPGANVNHLLEPWVTGLWLGRDTLSWNHEKQQYAVFKNPTRWVPAALNAMLFTT